MYKASVKPEFIAIEKRQWPVFFFLWILESKANIS